MYHIVYLTTNIVNNKIYIGKQSSSNLNDGYLGSGTIITKAIKKYGKDNFRRTILYYCLSENDAFELERMLVDEWFITRSDTYNISLGGNGSFAHVSKSNIGKLFTTERKQRLHDTHIGHIHSDTTKDKIKNSMTILYKNDEYKEKFKLAHIGKKHSEETKLKMSESHKKKTVK